ncbi:hypothetical protein [Streptomyces siamensis]|uniref:Uncharacterized protein n=1 Tax=Streptomyces siamensis TaxID=1274986 RepID=A0ABP9J9K7_9ACTN
MKKLMTRVALAAATVTMTGVAVTGTASAATLPTAQHNAHHSTVATVAERAGLSRIGQGWSLSDGQREWHGERDQSGYSYWRSDDHGQHLRYDGHRVYHRHHGQWTAVTQADERAYAFDRWHFDQLWTLRVIEDPYGI